MEKKFKDLNLNSTDEYVNKTDNKSIHKLHEKIVTLKKSREWEEGYMKFEELLSRQRRDGHSEGLCRGVSNSIITVLSKKGEVTNYIKEKLEAETDVEVLNSWLNKAIEATTIEEFAKEIN